MRHVYTELLAVCRLVALAATVFLFACDDSDDKGDETAVEEDNDTAGEADTFDILEIDYVECAGGPGPREDAQMTGFVNPDLLTYVTSTGVERFTERGLVLYGGVDPNTGAGLDDLWLFDLSRAAWEECPWTLLSADATVTAGIAEGTLIYDGVTNAFWLIGGRKYIEATQGWKPVSSPHTMSDLEGEFLPYELAEPYNFFTTAVVRIGANECGSPLEVCLCEDPNGCVLSADTGAPTYAEGTELASIWYGIGTVESHREGMCFESWYDPFHPNTTCTDTVTGGCVNCENMVDHGVYDGCDKDPYCMDAANPYAIWLSPTEQTYVAALDEYISESTFGRIGSMVVFNPVAGQIQVLGGSTGCTAGDCGAYEGLLVADNNLNRTVALHAANNPLFDTFDVEPGALVRTAASPTVPALPWCNATDKKARPPGDPTAGVHGGAASYFGLAWDPAHKQWGGTPEMVVWGATVQQEVAPTQHLVLTGEYLEDSHWEYWPPLGLKPDSDPDVGGIGDCLIRLDSAGQPSTLVSSGLPWAYNGAMERLSQFYLVTYGGEEPEGGPSSTLRLVDYAGTVVDDGPVVPAPRVASGGDPIGMAAWFYGDLGAYTGAESVLLRVIDGNTHGEIDEAPDLVLVHQEARLIANDPDAADPTFGTWAMEIAYSIRLDCNAGYCAAQKLYLEFPRTEDPDSVVDFGAVDPRSSSTKVYLRHVRSTGEVIEVELEEAGQLFTNSSSDVFQYSSPVTLVATADDEPTYDIIVRSTVTIPTRTTIGVETSPMDVPVWTTFGTKFGAGCDHESRLMISRGWWTNLYNAPGVQTVFEDEETSPYGPIVIRPPDGMEVVGPMFDEGCVLTPDHQWVLEAPDPELDRCFDLTGGARHYGRTAALNVREDTALVLVDNERAVWLDTCVDSNVSSAFVEWAFGADEYSYEDEVAYLNERIGDNFSNSDPVGIWLGRAELRTLADGGIKENLGGLTAGRTVSLSHARADGTMGVQSLPEFRSELDMFATHELAHSILNRVNIKSWLVESAPSLLHAQRSPELMSQLMYDGFYQRQSAFIHDDDTDLIFLRELEHPYINNVDVPASLNYAVNYEAAPYVLAQVSAGYANGDALAFWHALRDELAVYQDGASYDYSVLAHFIMNDLGEMDAYAERIHALGVKSEPLLGITEHVLDGGASALVHIEQVQVNMSSNLRSPFGHFTYVPYALACQTINGDLAYDECTATASAWYGPMQVLTTLDEDVLLHASAGVNVDTADTGVESSTQAVWFALLSGPALLPGEVPFYGIIDIDDAPPTKYLTEPSAPTWQLFCTRGSVHEPLCGALNPDADGDGYRALGDCNDADASVFPDVADPDPSVGFWSAGSIDLDCDGWPVDFWKTPPTSLP